MGFGEGVSPSACASGTGNIKRQRGGKRKRTTLSQFWKSHLDTNNRAQTLELNQFTLQKKPWSKHHALSPCFVLFFSYYNLHWVDHTGFPQIGPWLHPSPSSAFPGHLPQTATLSTLPVSSFSVSFRHNAQPPATGHMSELSSPQQKSTP